jgi:hypothetical protein
MELTASRQEGIAGFIEELGPVYTERIDDGLRERIESLVRSVGFFGLQQPFPQTSQQSDAMSYSLSISTADEERTVRWDDNHEAPRELAEIVAALEESGATWHAGPGIDATV